MYLPVFKSLPITSGNSGMGEIFEEHLGRGLLIKYSPSVDPTLPVPCGADSF